MATRNLWTHDELVLALALYFQLPFGRLNHGTPEVQELGRLIGRTKNSVALRLVNFAACDPYILSTGRHGMSGGEKVCQPIWDEYVDDKGRLFREAAEIKARLHNQSVEDTLGISLEDFVGHEREAIIRQRIDQSAFRTMVLNNYECRCAVTGITIPELLVASHIIPWAERSDTRLNPENGIYLSALYDMAFDRGLIGIDSHYEIILSDKLKAYDGRDFYGAHFAKVEHQRIILPEEHKPDLQFLEWHRDCIFNR